MAADAVTNVRESAEGQQPQPGWGRGGQIQLWHPVCRGSWPGTHSWPRCRASRSPQAPSTTPCREARSERSRRLHLPEGRALGPWGVPQSLGGTPLRGEAVGSQLTPADQTHACRKGLNGVLGPRGCDQPRGPRPHIQGSISSAVTPTLRGRPVRLSCSHGPPSRSHRPPCGVPSAAEEHSCIPCTSLVRKGLQGGRIWGCLQQRHGSNKF